MIFPKWIPLPITITSMEIQMHVKQMLKTPAMCSSPNSSIVGALGTPNTKHLQLTKQAQLANS